MDDCCSKNKSISNEEISLNNLDGLICYCFKKSKKELFEAIKKGNESSIIDEIKSKMITPGCFCESANPSGRCCMGDIQAFIKAVKKT